jgi:hypothetical protein
MGLREKRLEFGTWWFLVPTSAKPSLNQTNRSQLSSLAHPSLVRHVLSGGTRDLRAANPTDQDQGGGDPPFQLQGPVREAEAHALYNCKEHKRHDNFMDSWLPGLLYRTSGKQGRARPNQDTRHYT